MSHNKEQLILIVSGPDMTGKTEITSAVSAALGVPRFKAASEHDTYLNHPERFRLQLQYADTRLVDFMRQTGASAVFDRGLPCEFAYSKVFGRETDMVTLRKLDTALAELGARIVITVRSSYAGIVDDLDPKINTARLVQLDEAYREFASWTACRALILNVDDEDLQREVNDIVSFVREGIT